jgi:tetratricopeptide (TPR) repeat protein
MPSFKITRQFKILLLILFTISVASFTVAYFYYQAKNKAEDPRIADARFMLQQYDKLIAEKKYSDVFSLLDSVEAIFNHTPGYRNSYEPGIVFNNRGSAFLSMALYEVKDSTEKQQLLGYALKHIDTCILIYQNWLDSYSNFNRERMSASIAPYFLRDDPDFKEVSFDAMVNKRIDDLLLAQKETPRRLSVAYTNRGIIQRHQYRQTEAMESYITAIKLWKDNFTARNNFNVLMGIDPEDRSIVDQLFPPDKNK